MQSSISYFLSALRCYLVLSSNLEKDGVWFWRILLAFLSGIDRRIFDDVYVPLGDVWDAAVIVNSAVNFILYCTMSSQFRATFAEVICRRRRRASGGQTGTAVRDAQRASDGGMLVRWRLILRSRTAPVSSFVHCGGILSAAGRAKTPSPL